MSHAESHRAIEPSSHFFKMCTSSARRSQRHSKMPPTNGTDDSLNARARKLPKNSDGKVFTRDLEKQRKKEEKEMEKFLSTLDTFYERVKKNQSI